jgi:hydrogenase maturation protein HypF
LRHRTDREDDLVDAVAPGNPFLGVMLPYTPLHHLLMEAIERPIVCTSGNLSEEPMAIDSDDALARLGSIADVWLVHDRPIVRPVDDSVARVTSAGLQIQRRARGYAPLPIELGRGGRVLLAVGGHLKNTVGLTVGSKAVLSSHVGDLDHLSSVEVHRQAIRDLVTFFQVTPEAVVCDLHPDYASTRSAEQLADEWHVPLVRVQHHHAHVAACMAEHHLEGPVLGLSWDGTGYGTDGTVWGGEVLECQGPTFRRIAHLRTFALPGGDRAVRQPRRSALGVLFEILGEAARRWASRWFDERELDGLMQVLQRRVNCPRTSSMGRLFDAVAAIGGLSPVISFEGQAAMALEFAADPREEDSYPLPLSDDSPAVADWELLLRAVLTDCQAGVALARISARLHNSLADLAVAVASRWGGRQVVLTGGCFQNALLAERVRHRLASAGFTVYTHQQVPPGDGGIALGQLAIAQQIES